MLLKDVKESQRICKGWVKEIKGDLSQGKDFLKLKNENFGTLVASTGYWPVDSHDNLFEIPQSIKNIFENF